MTEGADGHEETTSSLAPMHQQPPPTSVSIGNVTQSIHQCDDDDDDDLSLIPIGYLPSNYSSIAATTPSSSCLEHLQWMMKKSQLGQDMLLVGTPSTSIYRRRVVMMYAQLIQRPIQILSIHQDLTESDLKQRRELITMGGSKASIQFINQPPVEAAIHGHLLLLDGLERAERNVLPTLNNLLENREMPLEDGRFLVSRLNQHHQQDDRFLPVHPNFSVVALSSIPPLQRQQPLDPPLRSRFQIRRVDHDGYDDELQLLLDGGGTTIEHQQQQRQWLQLDATMKSVLERQDYDDSTSTTTLGAWSIPSHHWKSIFETSNKFGPNDDQAVLLQALRRSYPVGFGDETGGQTTSLAQDASTNLFRNACRKLNLPYNKRHDDEDHTASSHYVWDDIQRINNTKAVISFRNHEDNNVVTVDATCGTSSSLGTLPIKNFCQTTSSSLLLTEMLQEHAVSDCDMLLLGAKGEGKTTIATAFCHLLGHETPYRLSCTKEMTVRDLYQRRRQQQQQNTINNADNSCWDDSPLTMAMKHGNVCLLEDVQQLSNASETIVAALQTLAMDREVTLPDGTRMVRADRYQEYLKKRASSSSSHHDNPTSKKIQPIHPSFRLVALATTKTRTKPTRGGSSTSNKQQQQHSFWSEQVMGMFKTIQLSSTRLSNQDWMDLLMLHTPNNDAPKRIAKLRKLRKVLEKDPSVALECGIQPLSMRNMVRALNNSSATPSLYEALLQTFVADLLPPKPQRDALDALLKRCGIQAPKKTEETETSSMDLVIDNDMLRIGDLRVRRFPSQENPELVPHPTPFFDIPHHVKTIQQLLQEWMVGNERAFLLVGNQGVGKNKLVDRTLQLANKEREYLQLHRDSTIGQITLSPSLEDGQIVWKDSPLVRAVLHGRALVVDEADKAPMDVVHVLKGLVQDGYLLLADGRMIVRQQRRREDDDKNDPNILPIHPDFTLWVLANRPGIPFHGNDFFREMGDCFSTHVVSNPDLSSEITLLESYAPKMAANKHREQNINMIESIARAFGELRTMSDHGELSYPYSTREAVAIVKHLEEFPNDDPTETLWNVLDMDSLLDPHVYSTILQVFRKHGFPIQEDLTFGARIRSSTSGSNNNGPPLSIEYHHDGSSEGTSNSPPKLNSPKFGKWDDKNEAHVGGNQWAGGTGGSDTAGLGGRGGPYRLDRGHKVHQVSDEAKAQVSKEAQAAARAMAKEALQKRLEEIGMSEMEYDMYQEFVEPMQTEIANLRSHVESSLEAKRNTERTWIKRQSYGEMDDSKIMDGVAGDKYIYKRRGVPPDGSRLSSQPLKNPKRIRFVMDCSGSMYRFNGYDQRLQRSLEAAALIMEALDGRQDLVEYSLVGHSGDSPCIPFVNFGKPPKTELQKMRILQGMMAHTQYCQSGDYTLEAMEQAMQDVQPTQQEEAFDECIVIAISDANLARYGIHPRELGQIMERHDGYDWDVSAYCIFIASLGQEAEDIRRALPVGRGHVCMDTKQLPAVVRSILSTKL